MKKVILFAFIVIASFSATQAQDVNRTLGVGLQSSFPSFGLSAKYAIADQSVIQATVAPFGAGVWKMNFFGARYIHRWTDAANLGNAPIDPYVFGGVGLVTYKTTDFGANDVNESFFSFSAGGGAELIVASKLGISLELGVGQFAITNGAGAFGILGGFGIHYYLR